MTTLQHCPKYKITPKSQTHKVSTGGWNPMLIEALQTMFDTGLPAIVYEELTGDEYRPVDGIRHIK